MEKLFAQASCMGLKETKRVRPCSRLVVRVALWTILLVALSGGGCTRASESRAHAQSGEPSASSPVGAKNARPELPDCPEVDFGKSPKGAQQPGNHKVILSWNASEPSISNGARVGYCLYRALDKPVQASKPSPKENSKKKAPCKQCERVNIAPVMETACVDEIVRNDA